MIRFARGGLWRGSFKAQSGANGRPIIYTCYGSDALPKPRIYGSKSLNQPADWVEMDGLWRTAVPATEPGLTVWNDVGNMIFINESGNVVQCGIKCWKKAELTKENRFWHDPETAHIWYYGAENPAITYSEVEAALRLTVIEFEHNVVISGFYVRYSGAHGIASSYSLNAKILNCDVSWCGGCWQTTQGYLDCLDPNLPSNADPHYKGEGNTDISVEISPGKYAIRYGDGIEFWCHAIDNLVEGCRVWEIFDGAISNHGTGPWPQWNITYRNNIIWNSEPTYQQWSCGDDAASTVVGHIFLTNNIFLNSGNSWGHGQRRNEIGHHLQYYCNEATTINFKVTNNVILNATQQNVQYQHLWMKDNDNFISNYNVWGQLPGRAFVLWGGELMHDFHLYQEKTGLDMNSIVYDCTVAPASPDAASGVAEWAEYEFCDCLSQPSDAEKGACLLAWLEKYNEYRAGYGETAPITLTVHKDGVAWNNHGKTFTLKRSDDESIAEVMTGAGNTLKATVLKGVWKLYEDNAYTGVTFNNDTYIETTLNYYTVTYRVFSLGAADGAITAEYDGSYIPSGAVVLGGKTLTVTASAGNTACTYAWSGTARGTDATYTTVVKAKVNADCSIAVITGVEELPVNPLKAWVNGGILHVSGLTVGKVWNLYSVSGALVKQGIAGSEPLTVNLEHTGVYIVRSEIHTYTVVYH